jgi:hypothetical protein
MCEVVTLRAVHRNVDKVGKCGLIIESTESSTTFLMIERLGKQAGLIFRWMIGFDMNR